MDILSRHGIDPGIAVRNHLECGMRGEIGETPKPDSPLFRRVDAQVIATSRTALLGAAAFFSAQGITPVILGDSVTGEAREVARPYGALAREIAMHGLPWKPPVALLCGGECTVTVTTLHGNAARGGRCSEFLLSLALDLSGNDRTWALACDTDGIDGTEDNAGAVLTPDTLARAGALGMDAQTRLEGHDAWGFFHALGDLVVTGPTLTNVNDYRAILVT
jgi:hydroxypyruvate reductase